MSLFLVGKYEVQCGLTLRVLWKNDESPPMLPGKMDDLNHQSVKYA